MGQHVSRYRIRHMSRYIWEVECPGWTLGICAGHSFSTKREAREWITKKEEGK